MHARHLHGRGAAMPDRRAVLAALLGAGLGLPGRAHALGQPEAEAFVAELAAEMTSLVQSGRPVGEQAAAFRDIFVRYSALQQISRFVMGITWRDMSEAQKRAFETAFLDYVGRVYSQLLLEYEGQTIEVRNSRDFGDRGILVVSVGRGPQVDGTEIEWLVSDRAGDGPKLVDITAEGVSLLQTQRQEFAAMLDRRNGDIDQFIADLGEAS